MVAMRGTTARAKDSLDAWRPTWHPAPWKPMPRIATMVQLPPKAAPAPAPSKPANPRARKHLDEAVALAVVRKHVCKRASSGTFSWQARAQKRAAEEQSRHEEKNMVSLHHQREEEVRRRPA